MNPREPGAQAPLSSAGGEGLGERRPAPQQHPGEANVPQPEPNSAPHSPNQKLSALDFHLGGDSAAFVRLMNALARASRETMLLQKYREACAHARAALRPLRDPNRELSEEERRAIVREVDGILGLKPIECSE